MDEKTTRAFYLWLIHRAHDVSTRIRRHVRQVLERDKLPVPEHLAEELRHEPPLRVPDDTESSNG